ncbi:MAG: hypothetical protein ACPL5F_00235 [Moorellaceae bacterium]
MAGFSELLDIVSRWRDTLMNIDNVVAVGCGYKTRRGQPTGVPAIIIYVSRKVPAKQLKFHQRIPPTIEGAPTDVVEAGEIRILKERPL